MNILLFYFFKFIDWIQSFQEYTMLEVFPDGSYRKIKYKGKEIIYEEKKKN